MRIALYLLAVSLVCLPNAAFCGTIRVPIDQPTIQAGINAAIAGDTVLVEPGTYFENINFRGKNIVVTSRYFLAHDITMIHSTVINGSVPAFPDTGSCVLIISGEDTTAVLQGFTLTGGTGTSWTDEHGAGLYNEGGGILIALSSPTIQYNIIRNNNVNRTIGVSTGGGGIRMGDGSPRIYNNFITRNAGMYGGGIVSNYATPIIRNNIIAKNVVSPAIAGRPTFGGGGVWINNQPARLDNNTIVENSASGTGTAPAGRGGGIVAYWGGSANGSNNIVFNNTQTTAGQLFGTFNLTYCDVQGGASGTGNFNRQPQFLDSSYFLGPLSPCIDAGDSDIAWNDPENLSSPGSALFPAHNTVRCDMGAYGGPRASLTFSLGEAPVFDRLTTGSAVTTPSASRSANWIDYDNDGALDLFVSNGPSAGQNNFLYHNTGDPAYTLNPVTGSPIVLDNAKSDGSSWADFDNNGTLDAFVVNWYNQNNMFFMGDGAGGFTRALAGIIVNDGGYSETCTWGDYDNDGYVDLYVTNSGYIGGGAWPNYLYHNNGDSTFTKISSGDIVTDAFYSRGCSWIDYDGDGDLDMFVANENGDNNCLYTNMLVETSTPGFQKVTTGSIVNDGGDSWSGSWGDYDNDGDPDLFVANFSNQNDFLYQNNGDGTFTRILTGVVVNDSGWSASSAWGDIDNDGDLDLIVTSAYGPTQLKNSLYRNALIETGNPGFEKILSGAITNDPGWAYGVALGDMDRDGDLDVFMSKTYGENEANALYVNGSGASNHWLSIRCTGDQSNRSAIGTRLHAKAVIGGIPRWQMREISGQSGYCGQSLESHFGFGDATVVDSLLIEWPSGNTDVFTAVATDRLLTIRERDTIPVNLQLPIDGSLDEPPSILFTWDAAQSTATYRFQLSTDSTFAGTLYDDDGLEQTSHPVTSLPLQQTYFWRVGVSRLGRFDGWSVVRSFFIGAQPYTYQLAANWNLVSLPVQPVSYLADTLFSSALSPVYGYSPSGDYAPLDTLTNGSGYWVKFPPSQSVTLRGFPINADTFAISAGWNLIGSVTEPATIANMTIDPPGILSSRFYGFANGYATTDTLLPMHGYWIKATAEGTIILNSTGPLQIPASLEKDDGPWNVLTFTDATGSVRTLRFRHSPDGTRLQTEELPPPPPTGLFDARLLANANAGGATQPAGQSMEIALASAVYPVSVEWQVHGTMERYALTVDGGSTLLGDRGALNIDAPSSRITLVVAASADLPRVTRLEQNYPNPFNPSTTIAYDIAVGGEVRLQVFDLLGREIRTLVAGTQEQGRYTVQWNGTDGAGKPVATGLYYCRLTTTEAGTQHMDVRKMLVME